MNKDDILKMEAGREMDELILVHIFGYQKLPLPADPEYQKPTEDGVLCAYHINRYSTDIKAAWEVANNKLFKHFQIDRVDDRIDKWHVTLATNTRVSSEFADIPELAICRAALLAVME